MLVMEEFDPDKTVKEYEFSIIPMWIRVFELPLGSKNCATGELVGKDLHELVDVDVGHGGKAVGKFLQVKVKLDIAVLLMRVSLLDKEEERTMNMAEDGMDNKKKKKKLLWGRFEYEHMSDFGYTCGIIGHSDKECRIKLTKREAP